MKWNDVFGFGRYLCFSKQVKRYGTIFEPFVLQKNHFFMVSGNIRQPTFSHRLNDLFYHHTTRGTMKDYMKYIMKYAIDGKAHVNYNADSVNRFDMLQSPRNVASVFESSRDSLCCLYIHGM